MRINQQSEHALADHTSELAAIKQQKPHTGILLSCPGVFPTLESPALLWVLDMKTQGTIEVTKPKQPTRDSQDKRASRHCMESTERLCWGR